MASGPIHTENDVRDSIAAADRAILGSEPNVVEREWTRLIQIDKTLKTPDVAAKIASYAEFLRNKHAKVLTQNPSPPVPAFSRAQARMNKIPKPEPATRAGLELRAAKREARELALIKTTAISPEDLLPESVSKDDPKIKAILSACSGLVAADCSDMNAILDCIPALARACLKYSPDSFIAKSILFAFSIRRDLPDETRERISAHLSTLLDTDDKDLSSADTDEMVEPDDSDLSTVEEVSVDADFSDLLEEEK